MFTDTRTGEVMNNVSMRRISVAVCLLTGAMLLAAPYAHASTFFCSSTNTPAKGSTVSSDVEVQSGAVCILDKVTVTGNVTADSDSNLTLEDGTLVEQNLTVETPLIQIAASHIHGQSLFNNGSSKQKTGSALVCSSEFDGPVSVQGETNVAQFTFGSTLSCSANSVTGLVSFEGNVLNNLSLTGNNISGGISFEGNVTSATAVIDNAVSGSASLIGDVSYQVQIQGNTIHGVLGCAGDVVFVVQGRGTNVVGHETGECTGF
jgi:hypothetical protein